MVWGLVHTHVSGYYGNYCLLQIVPTKAAAFSLSTMLHCQSSQPLCMPLLVGCHKPYMVFQLRM